MPVAGLPDVRDGELQLQPAGSVEEVEGLRAVLTGERVTQWWGDDPVGDLQEELETVVLVWVGGELAGVMQCHEESYDVYPEVAFDIALGPAWQGRGLGPRVIRAAMRHYAAAGHHRFVIDPAVENTAAVAAYARAGFEEVGRLRSYERADNGRWRDGLMMQALAWEVEGVREVYTGPGPDGAASPD
jgi:aminoglycoside 6'-N-acetyltransferase